MANERVRGNDIGPTGETVAANIARARKSQQLSLQQLEERLDRLGRRISFSGLSKIERGQKRVDVDDLMAIAIALDVAPTALLMPMGEPQEIVEATGARGSIGLFWQWALGERTPFSRDERAFLARSLPYWRNAGGDGMTWFGRLELFMGAGADEPRRIETHEYEVRERSEVDWER